MKFSTLFLRILSPRDEDQRMKMRRAASEAEARSVELERTVTANHDTLVEALRRAFQQHDKVTK